MKNRKISEAYDSINPTAMEKQRMLEAILAQTTLEEPPKRRREPTVYTARPTRTSRWSVTAALAACVAVFAAGGFLLSRMAQEPTQPVYTPSNPELTQEIVIARNPYEAVLKKYKAAISEGWTKEQCQIEGISTRFYMPEPIDFTVGYQIIDLNGDGRGILVIGHHDIIWDLYATLEDGTPIQLLSDEQDGWQYHLCEDQRILCEYSGKDDSYMEYYNLYGAKLELDQQLEYRNGQWKIQKAGEDWQSITEKEVQDLTNSVKTITPDWIPLTQQIDEVALEYYMLTLEKYKTAIIEKWKPGECVEHGISLMVGYYGDFVTELGWAVQDLDGNGIQELIITDGTNVYDLYTMEDGTPVQMLSAMERLQYYLTQEGRIYFMGSGGAARSNYILYALEGRELRALEGFAFDADTDPDDPWFYYDGSEVGDHCDTETAAKAIDGYQIQTIPFSPFE